MFSDTCTGRSLDYGLLFGRYCLVGTWQADEDVGRKAFDGHLIEDIVAANDRKLNKVEYRKQYSEI